MSDKKKNPSSDSMSVPVTRKMNADDLSKRASQGKSNISGGFGSNKKKNCGGTGTGA